MLVRTEQLQLLASRLDRLGLNASARLAVREIVAEPLQAVAHLRHLHDLAAGVADREPGAAPHFMNTLFGGPLEPRGAPGWWQSGIVPMGTFGPCMPVGIVDPLGMFDLAIAVAVAANGDAGLHEDGLNRLADLWDRAGAVDDLAHSALHGEDDLRNGLVRGGLDPGLLDEGLLPGYDPWPPDGPAGPDDGPVGPHTPIDPDKPFVPKQPGSKGPGRGGPGAGRPGVPGDPCLDQMELCRRLVLAGSRLLKPGPLPVSTYATGITSIQPPSACPGAQIAIVGSFPATQPANVAVLLDTTPLTVVSWSSTRIVVIVPPNAKAGCIGFRNESTEAAIKNALQDRAEGFAQVSEGLACLGLPPMEPPVLTVAPSRAPCNGLNLFQGTLPEIDSFLVNGDVQVDVQPGASFGLAWAVRNATQVQIRQIASTGPAVIVDSPSPPAAAPTAISGSRSVGPWNDTNPLDETYRLTAVNACGQVTADVKVRLRKIPALKIRAMELIQAIQRPDPLVPPTPTVDDPVRLAARRRTALRVYVESGLTGGFVYGGKPNEMQITGTVDLAVSVGTGQTGIAPIGGSSFAKVTASRDDSETLEFELPWERLDGGAHLTVTVRPANPNWGSGAGYEAKSTMTAQFYPRKHLTLVRLRVHDGKKNLTEPSIATWQADMIGARDRFPVAEDKFIEAIAPGFDVITTTRNLDDKADWEELIDDVDDIADGFKDYGQIWVALTPTASSYSLNGIGHTYSGPMLSNHRVMVVQQGKPASYAHEMCHTFGVDHANCGAVDKDSVDNRLPAGGTEPGTLGRRMSNATLFKPGSPELMSYCPVTGSRQNRWPSVALWDILFNSLP